MHSDGYLTLGNTPGIVNGSWDVKIELNGSERSWVRLMPIDAYRREGDAIKYSDMTVITLRAAHLDYNLCSIQKPTTDTE